MLYNDSSTFSYLHGRKERAGRIFFPATRRPRDFRETFTFEGRACETLHAATRAIIFTFLPPRRRPSLLLKLRDSGTSDANILSYYSARKNTRRQCARIVRSTRTEDRIFTARREKSGKMLLSRFEETATNSPALYFLLFSTLSLSLSLSRSLSLKRTRYFRQEVDFSYPVFYKSISLKRPCTHHHQGWLIGLFRYRYQYVFQYWFCFISICLTNWPTFRYYAKRKGISRVHRSERIRFLKQPRRMEESTEE